MQFLSHSTQETEAIGEELAQKLRGGDVLAFTGSLGMELFDIGWDDYLARGGVCAVEWSERVSDALPADTIFVDIARTDEHEDWRTITVTGGRFA